MRRPAELVLAVVLAVAAMPPVGAYAASAPSTTVPAAPGVTPAATPAPDGAATPTVTPAPVPADEPWWVPVVAGVDATAVAVDADGAVDLTTAGGVLVSGDGRSFRPGGAGPPPAPPRWTVTGGQVLDGGTPDRRAPDLGAAASLIAAPAALPGTVVAVSDAGVVWRRDPSGEWNRTLVLLPRGITGGRPAITAIAAFTAPLTTGVYLATDGYSTLLSTDGGTEWLRAGPGLPDHVRALAADPGHLCVWAATDGGLFVHHLRTLPQVPEYRGPELTGRRLKTAGITLLAVVVALAGLVTATRPRRTGAGPMLAENPEGPTGAP